MKEQSISEFFQSFPNEWEQSDSVWEIAVQNNVITVKLVEDSKEFQSVYKRIKNMTIHQHQVQIEIRSLNQWKSSSQKTILLNENSDLAE